jgi:preprotein translocase subunit SecD
VASDDESAIASEVPDARAADAPVIRIFGQIFDETAIRSVQKGDGIQGPLVIINMTAQGAKLLETESAAHIGRKLAILVDGKVYAVMTVQTALVNSVAVISGMEEAEVQRIIKAFGDIQKLNE